MLILKQLREQKGVFQKDVAAFLGVDRTTYVKYERGDSEPSLETLTKLAEYFEVTIDQLLGRKVSSVNNDDELSEYLEVLRTRPEMKMLFQLSKGASKEDVEKAVTIIETLLK